MDKKLREAIGEAVAKGLQGVETKLDRVTEKVDGLCLSMGSIETRLSTLEQQLQGVNDLVETAVVKEVATATGGLRDDISTLELKMDSVQQQLATVKDTNGNTTKEETSVIIRNLELEDDNILLDEVKDLFVSVLEISVHVETVERYKTHSKKPGPIRVQLKSKDDVTLVMTNKSKLMDYDNLDKVHIEAFMAKADVITRDNWNTVIRLLGNAGKGVRVAGTGRIVRRTGIGEQRPQTAANPGGGKQQSVPTTQQGATVSGTQGDPFPQPAKPLEPRLKKKKKRRPRQKGGTNSADNSHEVALSTETGGGDTTIASNAEAAVEETTAPQQSHEVAAPSATEAGQSGDEYVVVPDPLAGPDSNTQKGKPNEELGPKTRARSLKSSSEQDKEEESDDSHDNTISPIKTIKKMWSYRNK